MATLAERVDALRTDFALDDAQTIPDLVKIISQATNNVESVAGKPLAEQVRILFESVHGPVSEAGALVEVAEDGAAPPVAMGVPIDDMPPPAVVEGQAVVGGPQTIATMTTTVSRAIQDAIAQGAPTYNNGDATGCYNIYRRTAEAMVARLGDGRERALMLAALQQAALEAESASARNAAWTMRHCFDALRSSQTTLEGMPVSSSAATHAELASTAARASTSTDLAVPGAASGGRTTTLKHAIADAIDKGAPVYNRHNHAGCYYIYRRTAEEMLQRLDERKPSRRQLEGALARARALADPRGPNDSDGAAWTMRHCFDGLMAARDDPVLAGGMPPAAAIKREPGFPMGGGGPEASSCCVVA